MDRWRGRQSYSDPSVRMSCASSWKPDTKRFLLDFPARLYPVLNEEYATLEGKAIKGRYVTGFAVKTSYLAQFPIHKVGGTMHTESGIPAEKLAEFQQNIVGLIEAVSEFRGK